MNLDINGWHRLYDDLPSRQLKIPVKNKSLIICSDDETYVTSPIELQNELNKVMMQYSCGRCFVRPSGTEDVVRVYAEAKTQEQADTLAKACIEIITRIVG